MVHENVGRVRKARGVTKTRMAQALKLSPMGYNHLETGNVRLDVERLRVIAKVLSVNEAIFFDDKLTDSVIQEIQSPTTA